MSCKETTFRKKQYGSKTIANKPSVLETFDPVLGSALEGAGDRLLLSPLYQSSVVESFIAELQSLSTNAVCVGDLSATVYSDYRDGNQVLRQQALFQSVDLIRYMEEQCEGRVLLTAPNVRTALLSDLYTDIPLSNSGYAFEADSVPFYQMVFHGYADYSSRPLNYMADYDRAVLKCIEYGASPKFEWVYSAKGETVYSSVYADDYTQWLASAANAYAHINRVLQPVSGSIMLSHTEVLPQVFCVTYDNGKAVYVNYSGSAVQVDGITVSAMDAVVAGGAA